MKGFQIMCECCGFCINVHTSGNEDGVKNVQVRYENRVHACPCAQLAQTHERAQSLSTKHTQNTATSAPNARLSHFLRGLLRLSWGSSASNWFRVDWLGFC